MLPVSISRERGCHHRPLSSPGPSLWGLRGSTPPEGGRPSWTPLGPLRTPLDPSRGPLNPSLTPLDPSERGREGVGEWERGRESDPATGLPPRFHRDRNLKYAGCITPYCGCIAHVASSHRVIAYHRIGLVWRAMQRYIRSGLILHISVPSLAATAVRGTVLDESLA